MESSPLLLLSVIGEDAASVKMQEDPFLETSTMAIEPGVLNWWLELGVPNSPSHSTVPVPVVPAV